MRDFVSKSLKELDVSRIVDKRDRDGSTPLYLAIKQGVKEKPLEAEKYKDVIRDLILAGADPSLKVGGKTIRDHAKLARQESDIYDIVKKCLAEKNQRNSFVQRAHDRLCIIL